MFTPIAFFEYSVCDLFDENLVVCLAFKQLNFTGGDLGSNQIYVQRGIAKRTPIKSVVLRLVVE